MTADVYGNIIYGNNAKGNNRDALFHLGLLSFWLHAACPCLLFCVCKHRLKASALSTQVPKFMSIRLFYGLQKVFWGSKQELHSSTIRVLQGLASTKLPPLPLEVPNLKHCYHCFLHCSFSTHCWPWLRTGLYGYPIEPVSLYCKL